MSQGIATLGSMRAARVVERIRPTGAGDRAALVWALAVIATACGDGTAPPPPPPPAPSVATVEVAPATGAVAVSQTLQLTATPKDAQGNAVARPIIWSTSNAAIASVSSSGLVTGVTSGPGVVVTATSEGKAGSSTIDVLPATVVAVRLLSDTDTLVARGWTAQLHATATDAQGHVIDGRHVTWTSSDRTVATVNETGMVTALAKGRVTVTAEVDGIVGALGLRVGDADLPAIQRITADAYLQQLVIGLVSPEIRAPVQLIMNTWVQAANSGNVAAVLASTASLRALLVGSLDPTDRALVAVFNLFLDQADRLVQFD